MPVTGPVATRIGQIAVVQRSRVARRQLLAAGVTRHMVATRLKSKSLTEAHNGVYIVGPNVDVPLGRETAALLAVDASVLSHLTAGAVYEVIRIAAGQPIHVTVLIPKKSRPGIVVHRSRTLTAADLTLHHGLPITSVARTLFDIAGILPAREVEWALDEALGRKIVTLGEIRELLARTKGRRAAAVLGALVESRTNNAGSRTKWERRAAGAFRAAGFPPFEQNVWYLGYQHDFLWRRQRVALEIDGLQWHSTLSRMNRDDTKQKALERNGIDANRVTNADIDHRLIQVVALMAARLALRDPGHWGSRSVAA